jgi:protein-tyrosine phosphatase
MKYLMVCLGNICRSPLAQGILKQKLSQIGSSSVVESRGFEPYHIGDNPDARAQRVAAKNNIDISNHQSNLFQSTDFDKFDRIFVMDHNNFTDVAGMARNAEDMKKVEYIMNVSRPGSNTVVPDPYYGIDEGFSKVFEMLSEACDAIIVKYEDTK